MAATTNKRRGSVKVVAFLAIVLLAIPAGIYWFWFTDRSWTSVSAMVSAVSLATGCGLLALQTLEIPISRNRTRHMQ